MAYLLRRLFKHSHHSSILRLCWKFGVFDLTLMGWWMDGWTIKLSVCVITRCILSLSQWLTFEAVKTSCPATGYPSIYLSQVPACVGQRYHWECIGVWLTLLCVCVWGVQCARWKLTQLFHSNHSFSTLSTISLPGFPPISSGNFSLSLFSSLTLSQIYSVCLSSHSAPHIPCVFVCICVLVCLNVIVSILVSVCCFLLCSHRTGNFFWSVTLLYSHCEAWKPQRLIEWSI